MISQKIIKWLNYQKKNKHLSVKVINLDKISQWIFNNSIIYHKSKKFFKITGIEVSSNLYKKNWDQPIIIQKEVGISSWFGFSIILRNNLKNKRSEIIEKLSIANIETRPIVAGNFTKNPTIKYMDHTISGELKNSEYIDENEKQINKAVIGANVSSSKTMTIELNQKQFWVGMIAKQDAAMHIQPIFLEIQNELTPEVWTKKEI